MLISSISGIRGTLGDRVGEDLTLTDVRSFASAYGQWIRDHHKKALVVVGRDARPSGAAIAETVIDALTTQGIDVLDCGLATTPTIEMMVIKEKAQGAIIITASHNPIEYNGLKMLNDAGEFLSKEDGEVVLAYAQEKENKELAIEKGQDRRYDQHHEDHVAKILDLPLIDQAALVDKKFRVCVDTINSVGSLALKPLFAALGIEAVYLNGKADGNFAHMPEPLEKNLGSLIQTVKGGSYDFGIAVDPDVDRLVLVDEEGKMFGEEYTLIACADFVLKHEPGSCVSNLSSSRALADLAKDFGVPYFASPVGEKNVVEKMKMVNAVIGGEGSGGVIYPPLHYGRDALIGIALICMHLCEEDCSLSSLKQRYHTYAMAKEKIVLKEGFSADDVLALLTDHYVNETCDLQDGLKVDFDDMWVHIRKSNTEPLLRIYTEAPTMAAAEDLAKKNIVLITQLMHTL